MAAQMGGHFLLGPDKAGRHTETTALAIMPRKRLQPRKQNRTRLKISRLKALLRMPRAEPHRRSGFSRETKQAAPRHFAPKGAPTDAAGKTTP
ncbi:MAG TPA: hypothetical protein ENO19_01650 [Halothiobacillaceae bacterium]|nr:hypothetical protein [Halothiobacillaceae bacterium]